MFDENSKINAHGRLAGKRVFITGVGSTGSGWGNGRSIAVKCAIEGATVWGVDISYDNVIETEEIINKIGGKFYFSQCDVTSKVDIERNINDCNQHLGGIDVLINNVGGSSKGGLEIISEEEWDAQFQFNLKSIFFTCKSIIPILKKNESSSIVNISSVSGIRWTGSNQIAYSSAKSAVIQFSKTLALELASNNIRVNTVIPGQLYTPLVSKRLVHQKGDGDLNRIIEERKSRIPLPFVGDGRDTANAVVFLASDEARFITATEILVDGGMTTRCN